MTLIKWPEISDVGHHIDLMVSFVSGRDMQALGEFISLDAAKALYSGLGADALKGNRSMNPVLADGFFQEAEAEAGEQFHGSSAS